MRRYAQWFDGEYFRPQSWHGLPQPNVQQLKENAQRIVRLHMLFGNTLVLNDVHLFDSPVVQALFVDDALPEELARLARDSQFSPFELVANPDKTGRALGNFGIATWGLRRTLKPGWISSSLGTAQPITRFADLLLSSGSIDLERMLVEPYPRGIGDLDPRLSGPLRAIEYFSRDETSATKRAKTRAPVTMYDILEELYARGPEELGVSSWTVVHSTKKFIDDNVPDRGIRSAVMTCLEEHRDGLDAPTYRAIRNTVIHAWNAAVQRTLAPDGASVGALPDSVPVSLFLDRPCDALYPFDENQRESSSNRLWLKGVAGLFKWDPLELEWPKVTLVFQETDLTRQRYQEALARWHEDDRHEEQLEDAIREHATALERAWEKKLTNSTPRSIPAWALLAAAVAPMISHNEVGQSVPALVGGYQALAQWTRGQYRAGVINTITKAARRMDAHSIRPTNLS